MHAAAAADALEREGLPDATSFQRSKARERGRSDHQPSDGESPNRRGCVPQEHRLFGGRHSLGRRTYLPEVITADTREVGHVGCRVGTGSRETDCLPLSDPSRLHHRGALRRRDRRSHSWPDPDLKPDAQRDFPGSVPIQLRHFFKDGRATRARGSPRPRLSSRSCGRRPRSWLDSWRGSATMNSCRRSARRTGGDA